jgi:hypothetical protein
MKALVFALEFRGSADARLGQETERRNLNDPSDLP